MHFEFDSRKDKSNQEKHGVSFSEAAEIWLDPDMVVLHARKHGEKRYLAIGSTCSVLFSVIHTKRGESIRIISARRATEKERMIYEQQKD